MLSDHEQDRNSAHKLLIATVAYLSTLSVPATSEINELRTILISAIKALRPETSLFHPSSFHLRQALEVLALYCPLGVYPTEVAGRSSMDLDMISSFSVSEQYLNNKPHIWLEGHTSQLDDQEFWLWLGLVAAKATLALEDDDHEAPKSLQLAGTLATQYLEAPAQTLTEKNNEGEQLAGSLGRLALCDRIHRLVIVHDILGRMRQLITTLAESPFFDIYPALDGVLERAFHLMAEADIRHEVSLREFAASSPYILLRVPSGGLPLSASGSDLQRGWLAYRAVRRKFEVGRILFHGSKSYMCTAFLPGTPLSRPGLTAGLTSERRIAYATERLTNLEDIMSLFPGRHPCTAHLANWGKQRAETCEAILVAVIESGQLFVAPGSASIPIIPIVDTSTVALERAKVLMEMRAGEIMSNRTWLLISRFQLPFWFVLMRQASETRCSQWRTTWMALIDQIRPSLGDALLSSHRLSRLRKVGQSGSDKSKSLGSLDRVAGRNWQLHLLTRMETLPPRGQDRTTCQVSTQI